MVVKHCIRSIFGKVAIRKYKSLVGILQRSRVNIGIYVSVQGLVQTPCFSYTVGIIFKKYEISLTEHRSNQLCKG